MLTKIVTHGVSGLLIAASIALFASGAAAEKASVKAPAQTNPSIASNEAFPPGSVALF
jgi:hypothetical protein